MNLRALKPAISILSLFILCGCRAGDSAAKSDPVHGAASAPILNQSTEVALPEIKDFGFIGKLTKKNGDWMLTIQYGELLRGEAAHDAAVKDGEIKEDEELEDDYYVREGDHETGTFKVDPAAKVFLHEAPDDPPKPMKLADFLASAGKIQTDGGPDASKPPYWFTLIGDRITRIEQQYVP